MSLILYFAPMSTASITQGVLAELNIPHELVELNIDAGDTRKSEFLAINPNGRVPTLVHDGVAIWESAAITLYLGDLYGVERGLYPPQGPQRGAAMKWVVWGNMCLADAAGKLSAAVPEGAEGGVQVGSVDYVAPEHRDPNALEKATASVHAALAILDNALSKQDYLIGEYSLADTHIWGFVGWIEGMGIDMQPFNHVTAWAEKCGQRPALAALMAEG